MGEHFPHLENVRETKLLWTTESQTDEKEAMEKHRGRNQKDIVRVHLLVT